MTRSALDRWRHSIAPTRCVRLVTRVAVGVAVASALVACRDATDVSLKPSGSRAGSLERVAVFAPLDFVNDLALDEAAGTLWAATDGGVVRWRLDDGSYVAYSVADGLPANRVLAVAVGPDGAVWAGTTVGPARLEGGSSWIPEASETAAGSAEVRAIAVGTDGTVWLGTNAGLARKVAAGWRIYTRDEGLPSHEIWRLAPDRTGGVWVLMAEDRFADLPARGGVTHLTSDGTWVVHPFDEFWPVSLGLAVDGAGRALFYHDSVGGLQSMSEDGAVERDPVGAATMPPGVQALAIGADGTRWIADDAGSVHILRPGADTWQPLAFLAPEAIAERTGVLPPNDIVPDQHGGVWFGGPAGIQGRGGDGMWHTLLTMRNADGLTEATVRGLAIGPDDAKWFATYNSVRRLGPDGTWALTSFADRRDSGEAYSVPWTVDAQGDLWMGTGTGVRQVSSSGTSRDLGPADGLPGNPVIAMAADPAGGVWFAARAGAEAMSNATPSPDDPFSVAPGPAIDQPIGVARRGPDGEWMTITDQDSLGWNDVRAICPDARGNMWLATRLVIGYGASGTGVSVRFSHGSWRAYTAREGLASNEVRAMAATTDGGMWFATDSGASFRAADDTWTSFTTAEGLPSDDVRGVAVDGAGAVWFATYPQRDRGGLAPGRLQGGGLAVRAPDGAWRAYTTADGLPSNQLQAVAVDRSSTVWLGTMDAGAVAVRVR